MVLVYLNILPNSRNKWSFKEERFKRIKNGRTCQSTFNSPKYLKIVFWGGWEGEIFPKIYILECFILQKTNNVLFLKKISWSASLLPRRNGQQGDQNLNSSEKSEFTEKNDESVTRKWMFLRLRIFLVQMGEWNFINVTSFNFVLCKQVLKELFMFYYSKSVNI